MTGGDEDMEREFDELMSRLTVTEDDDVAMSLLRQTLAYNDGVALRAAAISDRPVSEEPDLADFLQYKSEYFDTVTGVQLDRKATIVAMQEEVKYMKEIGVWQERSWETSREAREELKKEGIEVDVEVYSKWVTCNKGDLSSPDIRSRLVACEVKGSSASSLDFFSATPPLEVLRIFLAMASHDASLALNFSDVRKAHLNGRARRYVLVKLPSDVPEHGGRWVLLLRSLYGCRDAASCWEEEIRVVMEALSFTRGSSSPALWYHVERGIRM